MAGQAGFSDMDERLRWMSAAGDPLERLSAVVDFVLLRADLDAALNRSDRSRGGRPPDDAVTMFRVLVLQALYTRLRAALRRDPRRRPRRRAAGRGAGSRQHGQRRVGGHRLPVGGQPGDARPLRAEAAVPAAQAARTTDAAQRRPRQRPARSHPGQGRARPPGPPPPARGHASPSRRPGSRRSSGPSAWSGRRRSSPWRTWPTTPRGSPGSRGGPRPHDGVAPQGVDDQAGPRRCGPPSADRRGGSRRSVTFASASRSTRRAQHSVLRGVRKSIDKSHLHIDYCFCWSTGRHCLAMTRAILSSLSASSTQPLRPQPVGHVSATSATPIGHPLVAVSW